MEGEGSTAENPSNAAEYLQELNRIIQSQQELLEKQRGRIEDLQLQVTSLCTENACLKDELQQHLTSCRLHHCSSGAVTENVTQEK